MTETGGARPPQPRMVWAACLGAVLLLLISCSDKTQIPTTEPPIATTLPSSKAEAPTAATDVARQLAIIDAETRALVETAATWHAPESVDVDKTVRIGLEVGNGGSLKSRIAALLPHTSPISGGTVRVGPTVRAKLLVNPNDAEVVPSDAVDASIGSDVQMLWTWFVYPKRPTSALLLTAHLEVPLSDGHTIDTDVPLAIRVDRTLAFTASQVFTNWATWSAIAVTATGAIGWWWSRRPQKAEPAPSVKQQRSGRRTRRKRRR